MTAKGVSQWGRWLMWALTACVVLLPLVLAASSPLQSGREFTYITGALAGVLALSLLCVQPLLAAGFLPGLSTLQTRRWHQWLGVLLLLAVASHIVGLYLTSPDDMLDALLLRAPTPFSLYGVIALWAVVLTGLSAAMRSRIRLCGSRWFIIHRLLAVIVVASSVVHALMIDGTMDELSKMIVCLCVVLATVVAMSYLQLVSSAWYRRRRGGRSR